MIPDIDYSEMILSVLGLLKHIEWLNKRLTGFEINYGSIISNLQSDGLVQTRFFGFFKGLHIIGFHNFSKKEELENHEISTFANAMNENCGAGELSPNDSWTWEEVENSQHSLVSYLIRLRPELCWLLLRWDEIDACF